MSAGAKPGRSVATVDPRVNALAASGGVVARERCGIALARARYGPQLRVDFARFKAIAQEKVGGFAAGLAEKKPASLSPGSGFEQAESGPAISKAKTAPPCI